MKRLLLIFGAVLAVAAAAQTTPPSAVTQQPSTNQQQEQGERRRGARDGFTRGVGGTIQSITADGFTLTNREGKTATVKINAETQFRRDGQSAKLSDFKVGDMVMVRGESSGENTWTASMVGTRTGMGQGGPGGQGAQNGQGMKRMREGLGKEFIAGEVKSIDGTKLTIARPDGQTQTIEVDENTSFKKGQESITLPDIKVGDRVMGRGKLNSAGVFVPETLNIGGMGRFGEARRGPRPEGQPSAPPKQ